MSTQFAKMTLCVLLLVPFAGHAQEGAENGLTEAMKKEIRERAKTEVKERELKREQERLSAYRKDIERQEAEVKRQTAKLQADNARLAQQQQSIKREIEALNRKEGELKKQLSEAEERSKAQEAEHVKSSAELEATKHQLAESNSVLEKKRLAVLAKLNENRTDAAKMKEELTKLQGVLGKANFDKFEYGKMMAQAEMMSAEIEVKTKQVQEEIKAAQSEPAPRAQEKKSPTAAPVTPVVPKTTETEKPAPARVVAGARPWKLGKLCNLYKSANPKSAKLMKVNGGTVVSAQESASPDFVQVSSGGVNGFMRSSCGSFTEPM